MARWALVVALALSAGAALGWHLHPDPAPGVDLRAAYEAARSWRSQSTEQRTEGPVRVVERWRTVAAPTPPPRPGCDPCPACEEHERVIERGPVTTTTATQTAAEERIREVVREVVTPAPRPGWAALLGLQVLPDQRIEVGIERRLFGPVWVRGWALQPIAVAAPAVGLGLRVEF